MEALEQKEIIPHFHFPVLPLTNTEHLLVKHLAVGYHYPVLSDIDFSIKGGQKVVITGFSRNWEIYFAQDINWTNPVHARSFQIFRSSYPLDILSRT